jgi:hypothetical protein
MMLLLQAGTPQTTNYMILGYVVFFSVMIIYLISLAVRSRSLHQDLELLQELEKKDEPK